MLLSSSSLSQALQYIVDLGFLHSWQSDLSCDPKHLSDCGFDCIVFSTSLCFMGLGCQPTAQPPTWTSKVSLFSWNLSLLTCLAWETLPVAMLLLAVLWRLMDHTNPTATMRWRCHWEDFIHTLLKNMTYCVAMIQLQNITEIEMSLSIL